MTHELYWSILVCFLLYAAWSTGRGAPLQAPHRPTTRETYVRLELTSRQGWNIVPGLELRPTDNLNVLREELRELMAAWLPTAWRDEHELALILAKALTARWGDRAWFLEVEGKDGEWVQVYQPWVPSLSKTAISGVR